MKKYVMETSPLGPSRKVKAAIRKAVRDINSLSGEGRARLERLFLSKYGVSHESLLFANSLKELVIVICRCLRPRKILIVGPALNMYKEAAHISGALIEVIAGSEENSFFPDLQELFRKAEDCDLVFMANPNRITGKALSATALAEVVAALSLKDCITVIDESLVEFMGDEGFIRRALHGSNSIVVRTTACYFGLAGLELAYAIAGPVVIGSLRRQIDSDPSVLAMEAARAAIRDKSYRRLIEQFLRDEKRLFHKALSRIPEMVMYDSDINIFLLKAIDLSVEIAEKAEEAGLAVGVCSDIEGLNDQYLRISVMKHDHNLKLLKLISRIVSEAAKKNGAA